MTPEPLKGKEIVSDKFELLKLKLRRHKAKVNKNVLVYEICDSKDIKSAVEGFVEELEGELCIRIKPIYRGGMVGVIKEKKKKWFEDVI